MGVSGRTSKVSSVVAAVCIFIYILAIAFAVVQIIENIGERRSLAENEFYDLADRASSSAVFLGFMSEAYQQTIKDFLGTSETLLGVIITGSDGEYAFERYQGSGIVWTGNSPRFRTGLGFPGEPFLLYLRIEGQRNVTIQAIYSSIDSELILKTLRNTLIAVLAALAIALITLLVELSRKNKANYYRLKDSVDKGAGSGRESHKRREVDIIRRPDFGVALKETSEPFSIEHQAPPSVPLEDEGDFIDIPEPEESPVETADIYVEEAPPEEPEEEPSNKNDQEDNPQGLFTPRGNIGWESYTLHRLNSELHRCASFEQDLVFIVMDFRSAEKLSDTLYRQIADEAVSFFAIRDLIFERGENGLAVIVPSIDLEQGIVKSEEFRNRIIAGLSEPPSSQSEAPAAEPCIGLSSRSGRLIEADRLMLEAAKALEKALEDPASPIIAFKSDPEKYREYIKNQH